MTPEKPQFIRLDAQYQLQSPLSHIGESAGPDSFLSQDILIGADGQPMECFTYSGNAMRGMWRDAAALHWLASMGYPRLTVSAFYLYFSGGALRGTQTLDLDRVRTLRRQIPMLSLWGGALGSQILPGKMKVGALYPMAAETQHLIPETIPMDPFLLDWPSWRTMTYDRSYTRLDDRRHFLDFGDLLVPEDDDETSDKPQQMRYTVELVAAGTRFFQRLDFVSVDMVEFGAWIAAWANWAQTPYLGGKSGTGHGLVTSTVWQAGQRLVAADANGPWLSDDAQAALAAYEHTLASTREDLNQDTAAAEDLATLLGVQRP